MKIKDKDGRWCYSQEDIEAAFVGYFTELFTAGKEMDMDDCLAAIDRKVTLEINQTLMAEFTVEEISSAMNQMPPLKAPGPDGFSACFY
jgi:hypothetical protein